MKAPSRHLGKRDVGGFTLIELLAVVGISLVLGALLFSTGKSVVKKGQRSGSMTNLRGISALAETYTTDHDGFVIPYESTEWPSAFNGLAYSYMFEYLPRIYGDENYRVFRRPGDDLTFGVNGRRSYNDKAVWSYARNLSLPQKKGLARLDNSFRRALLPAPSQTMLFMETKQNAGLRETLGAQVYFDQEGLDGKCMIAFVDGHCELRTRKAMGIDEEGRPQITDPETKILWFGYPTATTRTDY